MGFLGIGIGVVISTHGNNPYEVLNLICKSYTFDANGKTMSFVLNDDIGHEEWANDETIIIDRKEFFWERFHHRTYPWISFREVYCNFMMCLVDISYEDSSVEIADDMFLTFIRIKNELIGADRIPDSEITFARNCCS